MEINIQKKLELFLSEKKHIICQIPAYKTNSAGIKYLYFILSNLQQNGYIVHAILEPNTIGVEGYQASSIAYNSDLHLIDFGSLKYFQDNDISVTVIYPDSTMGNPFNAKKFIRLVNFYYGELNNNIPDNDREFLIFFGDEIKIDFFKKYPNFPKKNTATFSCPTRLLSEFDFKNDFSTRKTELYYEHKSKIMGLNIPDNIKSRAIKLDPNERGIIEKLQEARCVHIFEETAIIYEALLAGAVVNKHPDGFFSDKPIGVIGDNGIGIIKKEDPSENDIHHAQKELLNARQKYMEWFKNADNEYPAFLNFIKHKDSILDYNELTYLLNNNIKLQKKIMNEKKGTLINILWSFIKKFLSERQINFMRSIKKKIYE